jgi:hypothetical protein
MNCSEKGCIYPGSESGLCKYHHRIFDVRPIRSRPKTLQELEQVIERGMAEFRAVADALAEIHGRKLWKEAGYANFVEYCEKQWGLKQASAYNYLRAKDVVDSMPPEQAASVGLHQAVALSRIPSEQWGAIDASTTPVRKLASIGRRSTPSRNALMLAAFASYCRKHPEMDFWEALTAWRGSQAKAS